MGSYEYYKEMERSERRSKAFNKQFGGCWSTSVLLVFILICSPCICINKVSEKVDPE